MTKVHRVITAITLHPGTSPFSPGWFSNVFMAFPFLTCCPQARKRHHHPGEVIPKPACEGHPAASGCYSPLGKKSWVVIATTSSQNIFSFCDVGAGPGNGRLPRHLLGCEGSAQNPSFASFLRGHRSPTGTHTRETSSTVLRRSFTDADQKAILSHLNRSTFSQPSENGTIRTAAQPPKLLHNIQTALRLRGRQGR